MRPGNHLERGATTLRRQVCRVLVLRRFLRWAGVWWFLWGGMILGLRTVWGTSGSVLWVGAAAMPVLLLLAMLRERPRFPTRAQTEAVVDDGIRAGGLLMIAGEGVPTDAWASSVRPRPTPTIRWQSRKLVSLQIAGVLFLALSRWLPTPPLHSSEREQQYLDLRAMLTDYEAQIEMLAEEDMITPKEKAELLAMARRLSDKRNTNDPELAWEALDSLGSAIDDRAKAAAEKALERAVAEGQMTPEEAAMAAEAIAKKFAKEAGGKELAAAMADAAKGGHLDAAGLRRMAEAAEAAGMKPGEQLGRLADEGMIDGGQAGLAEAIAEKRQQARADLAAFLAKEGAGGNPEALAELAGANPDWGIDRGPGHAPLTWTAGSNEEGAIFKEETLVGKRPDDLTQSRRIGTDQIAPRTLGEAIATEGGALAGANAAGGSARTHQILPRHRRAVSTYFSRGGATGESSP
jgi:hypothetical protein